MKVVEEEKVEVNLELLQEILDYLQGRPYNEVYQIINKILIASSKEK